MNPKNIPTGPQQLERDFLAKFERLPRAEDRRLAREVAEEIWVFLWDVRGPFLFLF